MPDLLTHAVDDLVQLRRGLRVLDHPPIQCECHRVEQSPGVAVVQIGEGWMFPLCHDIRHALDVDYPIPVGDTGRDSPGVSGQR
jgi:hypothetical protein